MAPGAGPSIIDIKDPSKRKKPTKPPITKLDPKKLKLFQCGLTKTDIPKLTLKDIPLKDTCFIPCFYAGADFYDYHGIGCDGLVNVAHGIKEGMGVPETVTCPYSPDVFITNDIEICDGKTIYLPFAPNPNKPTTFEKYRAAFLKEVYRSGPCGTRGNLMHCLSEKIKDTYSGMYNRLHHGKADWFNGVYLKCNQCGALCSMFPNMIINMMGGMPLDPINKSHIVDYICAGANRRIVDGKLDCNLPFEGWIKQELVWLTENARYTCYNCGLHISEADYEFILPMWTAPISYPNYGWNTLILDQFKDALRLDNPPPKELIRSSQQYRSMMNKEVRDLINRMDMMHANTFYDLPGALMGANESNINFLLNQRMPNQQLTAYEFQEILCAHEVSYLVNGSLLIYPTAINVYHSLYDVYNCATTAPWFDRCALRIESTSPKIEDAIIKPVYKGITIKELLNADVLIHINTSGHDNYHVVGDTLLTPVTGSSVAAEWNCSLCQTFSNSAMIEIENETYNIITLKSMSHVSAITLVKNPGTAHIRMVRGKSHIKAWLPTVDINSLFKTLGLIGTSWKWQKLDTELVYRLLTNALTSKRSVETLMTYISGLTVTRYAVGGRLQDLTNIEIQDGIPELLYVLLILNDNRRLTAWIQYNYLGNINYYDMKVDIYRVMLTKTIRVLTELFPDKMELLANNLTEKTQVMFNRDNTLLRMNSTAKIDDIQPYKILKSTGKAFVHDGSCNICQHHTASCNHTGLYDCMCCYEPTDELMGYCSCCKPAKSKDEPHKCNHVCKHTHYCDDRKNKGFCMHANICVCCKKHTCHTICQCCYSEVVPDEPLVTSRTVKKSKEKLSNIPELAKKSQPKETNLNKYDYTKKVASKPKKKDKKGIKNKLVEMGGDMVKIKNVRDLSNPNELLFIDADGNYHCVYMPFKTQVQIDVVSQEFVGVQDKIDTTDNCLLHCFTKQTNLGISDLMFVVGPGPDHSLNDLIAVCKYYELNCIVQTTQTMGYIIRLGRQLDAYVKVAHTASLDRYSGNAHWYIPHRFTLDKFPKGYFDNVDLDTLNVERFANCNTFHDNEQTIKDVQNQIRNVVTVSRLDSMRPLEHCTVKYVDSKDAHYLMNADSDNLRAGLVKIKIDPRFVALVESVFSNETMTSDLAITTSTYNEQTPLYDRICEQIKNLLRNTALLRENMYTNRAVYDIEWSLNSNDNVIIVPRNIEIFKAYELINVFSDTGERRTILTGKGQMGVYFHNPFSTAIVKVCVPKQSYASCIRELRSLMFALERYKFLNTVSIEKAVCGVGGAGKSYWLEHTFKHKHRAALVTKLRPNMERMRNKGFKYCDTIEAMNMNEFDVDILCIDEGAIMDIVEIIPLLKKNNIKIYVLGDFDQIPVQDFGETPGGRLITTALGYFNDSMEKWTKSYRYGEPYISEVLTHVYDEIEKAETVTWDTTHDFKQFNQLEDVLDIIDKGSYTAVYTMYTEVARFLRDNEIEIPVYKVHSNQGSESDRVLYIHWSPDRQNRGVLMRRKYVTTALTRPRTHITVASNIIGFTSILDIIRSTVTGSGNFASFPINVKTLSIVDYIDENMALVLRNVIESSIDDLKHVNITEDKLVLGCKYGEHDIDVTITPEGARGNNYTTKLALTMYRDKIQDFVAKLETAYQSAFDGYDVEDVNNELDELDVNSLSTKSTAFYSAVEHPLELEVKREDAMIVPQTIDLVSPPRSTTSSSSADCVTVNTYKLSLTSWSRMVALHDAALINQKAYAGLKLNVKGFDIQVSVFNGCAISCGFKFDTPFGKVIISSGHMKNGDDLYTNAAVAVRTFVGSNYGIFFVRSIFLDDVDKIFEHASKKKLIARICNRIRVVSGGIVNDCWGGDTPAGQRYAKENEHLYEGLENLGYAQERVTHEHLSYILYTDRDVVRTYPKNKPVTNLNELIKIQAGYGALVDDFDEIDASNLNKMDLMLERKMRASMTEIKKVFVPRPYYKLYADRISNWLNINNIRPVDGVMADDTIAPIANALGLMYLMDILRIKDVDVQGMNASVLTLQGRPTCKLDITTQNNLNTRHLMLADKKAYENLKTKYEKETNLVEKEKLKEIIKVYDSPSVHMYWRNDREADVIFYGLGCELETTDNNTYFMTLEENSEYTTLLNGVEFLMGDQGRAINRKWNKRETIVLFKIGPLELRKFAHNNYYKCNMANELYHNVRRFTFPGTNIEPVAIPTELFKKLMARATSEDVTMTDMLSYTRSVMSTMIYTRSAINRRYAIDQNKVIQFCAVAMNISQRHRRFYKTIQNFIQPDDNTLMTELKNFGIDYLLSNMMGLLSKDKTVDFIKGLMKQVDRMTESPTTSIITKLITALKDIDVVEITPSLNYREITMYGKPVRPLSKPSDKKKVQRNDQEKKDRHNAKRKESRKKSSDKKKAEKKSMTNNGKNEESKSTQEHATSDNKQKTSKSQLKVTFENESESEDKSIDLSSSDNDKADSIGESKYNQESYASDSSDSEEEVRVMKNMCRKCRAPRQKDLEHLNNELIKMINVLDQVLKSIKLSTDKHALGKCALALFKYGKIFGFSAEDEFIDWVTPNFELMVINTRENVGLLCNAMNVSNYEAKKVDIHEGLCKFIWKRKIEPINVSIHTSDNDVINIIDTGILDSKVQSATLVVYLLEIHNEDAFKELQYIFTDDEFYTSFREYMSKPMQQINLNNSILSVDTDSLLLSTKYLTDNYISMADAMYPINSRFHTCGLRPCPLMRVYTGDDESEIVMRILNKHDGIFRLASDSMHTAQGVEESKTDGSEIETKDGDDTSAQSDYDSTGESSESYNSSDSEDKDEPLYVHDVSVCKCPTLPNDFVKIFNEKEGDMFRKLASYLDSKGFEWTISRGTILGALRYGALAFENRRLRFKNWVDADADVVVFLPKSKKPKKGEVAPLFKDLCVLLQTEMLLRPEDQWTCAIYAKTVPELTIDYSECDEVWDELVHHNYVWDWVSVDVGIAYYEDGLVEFEEVYIQGHAGVKQQFVSEEDILPRYGSHTVMLYGHPVELPRCWQMLMNATGASYGDGIERLTYPYTRSIEQAAQSMCDNYKLCDNFKQRWIEMVNEDVTDNSLHLFKTELKEPSITRGRNISVALMFAGSMGDYVPMFAVYKALKDVCSVTVYCPGDCKFKFDCKTILYAPTYKAFVHDDKKTANALDHINGVLNYCTDLFDFCIGPFFSMELTLLKSRINHIRLYPMIMPWQLTAGLKSLVSMAIRKLLNTEDINKTVHLSCVHPELDTQHPNIGMPIHDETFVLDEYTMKLLDHYARYGVKYTHITLGSMQTESFPKLIQSIMRIEQPPFLIVRGYSETKFEITLEGKKYDLQKDLFDPKLVVVPYINYWYLMGLISSSHHHGGCGTMQMALMWDTKQMIHPVDYDQNYNAEWLRKTSIKSLSVDVDKMHEDFVKNIRDMVHLGDRTDVEPVSQFYRQNVFKEILPDKPATNTQYKFNIFEATCKVLDPNISAKDCILTSMLAFIKDVDEIARVKSSYHEVNNVYAICTVNDLLEFCIYTQLSVNIYHETVGLLYKLTVNELPPYITIVLNDQLNHAMPGQVLDYKEYTYNYMHSISDYWINANLSTRVNSLESVAKFLTDNRTKAVLGDKDTATLRAAMNIDISRGRYNVKLRQRVSSFLITEGGIDGGFIVQNSLYNQNYAWKLVTPDGIVDAISLPSINDKSILVFHGRRRNWKVCLGFRTNKLKYMDEHMKLTLQIQSDATCINQVTSLYARSAGLQIPTVGNEHARTVYVYTTYNRPHHLEQETKLMKKSLEILPKQLPKHVLKEFKIHEIPRPIILQGKPYYMIEPAKTVGGEVIKKIVSSDPSWIKAPTIDAWYTDMDTTAYMKMNKCLRIQKGAHEEQRATLEWSSYVDWDQLEPQSWGSLSDKLQWPMSVYYVDIINKWAKSFGYDSEHNLMVQQVQVTDQTFEFWQEVMRLKYTMIDDILYTHLNATAWTPVPKGAGLIESKVWSDLELDIKELRVENKFATVKTQDDLTDAKMDWKQSGLISSLVPTHITRDTLQSFSHAIIEDVERQPIEVYEYENGTYKIDKVKLLNYTNVKTMDYWDQFNELKDAQIILPEYKKFKVRARIENVTIDLSTKLTMEPYPIGPRPSITRELASNLNSMTSRHGKVQIYQKKPMKIKDQVHLMTSTWFKKNWMDISRVYKENPLTITEYETVKWIADHNLPKNVKESLTELFNEGFEMNPINAIRTHAKIESVVKMDKMHRWFSEVTSRSIMASAYCISALFSPVFIELKKRFKDLLHEKAFYADGMTYQQLDAKLKTFEPAKIVVEDDLTKQDAQTTHSVNEVEKQIYLILGADPNFVEMYMWIHQNWKWKGTNISGFGDAMRLTGQPTTSLGNTIFNFMTTAIMYAENESAIIAVGVLSDDKIILAKRKLDIRGHGTRTKEMYNVISKVSQKEKVGAFLSMIVHSIDGVNAICPYFEKLRSKYGCCNYTYLPDEREAKLNQRRLSYAHVLGNVEPVKSQIEADFGVKIPDWYDVKTGVAANSIYSEKDPEDIKLEIGELCTMLTELKFYEFKMTHWISERPGMTPNQILNKLRRAKIEAPRDW